jgi:hypothetical protein
MTLKEFIGMVRAIALTQPNVNSVIDNDVYKLNELKDVEYSVLPGSRGNTGRKLISGFSHSNCFI